MSWTTKAGKLLKKLGGSSSKLKDAQQPDGKGTVFSSESVDGLGTSADYQQQPSPFLAGARTSFGNSSGPSKLITASSYKRITLDTAEPTEPVRSPRSSATQLGGQIRAHFSRGPSDSQVQQGGADLSDDNPWVYRDAHLRACAPPVTRVVRVQQRTPSSTQLSSSHQQQQPLHSIQSEPYIPHHHHRTSSDHAPHPPAAPRPPQSRASQPQLQPQPPDDGSAAVSTHWPACGDILAASSSGLGGADSMRITYRTSGGGTIDRLSSQRLSAGCIGGEHERVSLSQQGLGGSQRMLLSSSSSFLSRGKQQSALPAVDS